MKRFITAMAFLSIALTALPGKAQARSYAYCLKSSEGPGDCKYSSYRQCKAAASGTIGTCVRNYGPRR